MARKAVPRVPTPYELLALRIQKQLLTPRVQLERRVVIARALDELEEDWDLLLEQLSEEESVSMTPQADGSVHLTWEKPSAD